MAFVGTVVLVASTGGAFAALYAACPSEVAFRDASAVLAAWEARRASHAAALVEDAVSELDEADPLLVEAWESGRGARRAPGVRSEA